MMGGLFGTSDNDEELNNETNELQDKLQLLRAQQSSTERIENDLQVLHTQLTSIHTILDQETGENGFLSRAESFADDLVRRAEAGEKPAKELIEAFLSFNNQITERLNDVLELGGERGNIADDVNAVANEVQDAIDWAESLTSKSEITDMLENHAEKAGFTAQDEAEELLQKYRNTKENLQSRIADLRENYNDLPSSERLGNLTEDIDDCLGRLKDHHDNIENSLRNEDYEEAADDLRGALLNINDVNQTLDQDLDALTSLDTTETALKTIKASVSSIIQAGEENIEKRRQVVKLLQRERRKIRQHVAEALQIGDQVHTEVKSIQEHINSTKNLVENQTDEESYYDQNAPKGRDATTEYVGTLSYDRNRYRLYAHYYTHSADETPGQIRMIESEKRSQIRNVKDLLIDLKDIVNDILAEVKGDVDIDFTGVQQLQNAYINLLDLIEDESTEDNLIFLIDRETASIIHETEKYFKEYGHFMNQLDEIKETY